MAHKQQAIAKHFTKNCKQATTFKSFVVPPLEALGTPSIARKTAVHHCLEVNFA